MTYLDRARKVQEDLQRLADEISTNMAKAEDELTAIEDREARRDARRGPLRDQVEAMRNQR